MKPQVNTYNGPLIYYRLIALWVLCEAMLGGIIHGLRIPVSGLIVGSCAVICISLIAYYNNARGAILKATLVVAIFKMMLSPQAPPPAYIAVFFQGFLGELLFWRRRFYVISCFILALLALLESGLQRIIILTIVYGNGFWKAINDFINGLTKQARLTNYSLIIGGVYVFLHLLAGVFAGWWATVLPRKIREWSQDEKYRIGNDVKAELSIPTKRKKRRWLKRGLLIIWIALILLYIQSYFGIGQPLLPAHISLRIFIRSIIIVLSWYFLFGPLTRQLLHSWLQKKKTGSKKEIETVLELLPATQQLIRSSWQLSAGRKGLKRIFFSAKIILTNALAPGSEKQVYILTGPIGSGKTTSLLEWSAKRDDVYGILTPIVNGKRVFMDIHTSEQFSMEAESGETDILTIGKYIFSRAAFEKASAIIRDAINKGGWLLIDEVGPLELRGEGFAGVLREVLEKALSHPDSYREVILVVRDGLMDKVRKEFGIRNWKEWEIEGLPN